MHEKQTTKPWGLPGVGTLRAECPRRALLALLCTLASACGRAPAIDIEGSFFPVWMICLTAAMALTFCVRYVLARGKLESYVGPVALFYPSLIVLFTSLMWLIFFR